MDSKERLGLKRFLAKVKESFQQPTTLLDRLGDPGSGGSSRASHSPPSSLPRPADNNGSDATDPINDFSRLPTSPETGYGAPPTPPTKKSDTTLTISGPSGEFASRSLLREIDPSGRLANSKTVSPMALLNIIAEDPGPRGSASLTLLPPESSAHLSPNRVPGMRPRATSGPVPSRYTLPPAGHAMKRATSFATDAGQKALGQEITGMKKAASFASDGCRVRFAEATK
ncbi:hypothetical protein HDU96_010746 [Phlyctochytrium bullatum]|nr:hypothetical protein HDU96_010746 [Phlyctochytrium bullatum]